MTRYSRRTLLKASAAFAGTSAIGFPSIVSGQTEKIKIGHLTPLTGFLGALGAYAQLGIRMAEEEINQAGGVMGRQIEVMSEDSVNPATAATTIILDGPNKMRILVTELDHGQATRFICQSLTRKP